MIYINDLADELSSNTKLFADNTSLFSVGHNRDSSAAELNNDLAKVSYLAQQWKMNFNPDPSKQAQEVILSIKVKFIMKIIEESNLLQDCALTLHIYTNTNSNIVFKIH